MEKNKEDFVNVTLRIRPVISVDSTASSCLQVISNQPPVLVVLDRAQTYHFDNIFVEDIDQETVFNETVKPLVKYVKEGYNCTIFAYGQTGTGKTYTMGTNPHVKNSKDKGLIPRTLEEFFSLNELNDDVEFYISVSFIEIYNEKVFDLLTPNCKEPLPVKGFNVPGMCIESVYNSTDAKNILEFGNKNRHTAETKQNSNSSRSHAIFTIICDIRTRDKHKTAKLNLVDLAGSESVKRSGNQGNTFTEGVNINKGLLSIGQVVKALTTDASFVPYRQSIITSILQDSLNKNNFVSLIACVNSNPEDITETIQTLNFAADVKKMKNRPEVNEILAQYKKANPGLFRVPGTPFKRPYSTPFKTPSLKKVKSSMLPSLNMVSDTPINAEFVPPPCTNINEQSVISSSPKSLLSASVSSVSQSNLVQQSLSPVIKKYMSQMEATLMSRIETIIRDTVQRPKRSSSRGKENKYDSQIVGHWDEVRKEISTLVQQEISQLTVKAPRATSSPLELPEEAHVRRTLKYGSPDSQELQNNAQNHSFDFKKPKVVLKLKKKTINMRKTLSMSPIEMNQNHRELANKSIRKSVRLSLKTNDSDVAVLSDLDVSKNKPKSSKLGRVNNENDNSSMSDESDKNDSSTISNLEFSKNEPKTSKRNVAFAGKKRDNNENGLTPMSRHKNDTNRSPPKSCRRSVRLSVKRDMINNENDASINDFSTSTIKSVKTKKATAIQNKRLVGVRNQDKSNKTSPHTSHRRSVLHIINKGNAKEIANLHTVGTKTAEQIILFRRNKKLRYPRDKVDSKEVISILSAPKWRTQKRSYSTRGSGIVKKEPETSIEVQMTDGSNMPRMVLRKHKNPTFKTPATSKQQSNKRRIVSAGGINNCLLEKRKSYVLQVLNTGSLRDIRKLHTVGSKTAERILLYRQLAGFFNHISELANMPDFHLKKYRKFLTQNFLHNHK